MAPQRVDKMSRNLVVAALCISNNAPLLYGWAFPIQKSTNNIAGWSAAISYRKHHHPPYSSNSNIRHSLRISMATSEEKSEFNAEKNANNEDDDVSFPRPSQHNSENILNEFESSDIDWEPIDMDEMDDLFGAIDYPGDEYVDIDDSDELLQEFDKETLLEILGLEDDGETITIPDDDDDDNDYDYDEQSDQFADWDNLISDQINTQTKSGIGKGIEDLERALMGGVVPADAGVGSGILPGDQGFDPWELATKDYFKQIQNFILNFVPETKNVMGEQEPEAGAAMPTVGFVGEDERPPALILRDYREAEIRHGRLAMLAAVIWPLQEILDRLFIPNSFGSTTVIYGGPTLPFLPLIMTFLMLNLGYLDIYSSEIKENESGDAFLPGECFWDPLCILEGSPDSMKRNMQEREILNGRAAMIAVAAYIFEEAMTHKPIVALPTNALLFEPAYQVPWIQEWLDIQFSSIDYIDVGL
ncbi:hypothetical protein ACHAXR_007407 [Thalassiosira sp. AJA248-18]